MHLNHIALPCPRPSLPHDMVRLLPGPHYKRQRCAHTRARTPQITPLITHLLSMRGKKLWAYEDTCGALHVPPSTHTLRALVAAVSKALWFEKDIPVSSLSI